MIEYVIAMVVSLIPVLITESTITAIVLSISLLSVPTSCPLICNDMIAVLFSSSLCGMLIALLSFAYSFDIVTEMLVALLSSLVMSILYSWALERDQLEEIAELVTAILVVVAVGVMVTNPIVASQATFALAGSIWTVTPELSRVLATTTIILVLISTMFKDHIVSTMFDKEYISVMGSKPLVRYSLMFFISIFGIIIITIAIGLFAAQTVLILPTVIGVKLLRNSVEEVFPYSYTISVASLSIGVVISEYYNFSAIGVASLTMVILIVLLKLLHSISSRSR